MISRRFFVALVGTLLAMGPGCVTTSFYSAASEGFAAQHVVAGFAGPSGSTLTLNTASPATLTFEAPGVETFDVARGAWLHAGMARYEELTKAACSPGDEVLAVCVFDDAAEVRFNCGTASARGEDLLLTIESSGEILERRTFPSVLPGAILVVDGADGTPWILAHGSSGWRRTPASYVHHEPGFFKATLVRLALGVTVLCDVLTSPVQVVVVALYFARNGFVNDGP